jgi:hypothetical protein
MSRKIVTASLVVLCLSLSVRADDSKPPEKLGKVEKPITVPFELLKTGHIAVNVKVNDKGPYLIIFDTGAPMTVINNKLAKEAGLIAPDAKPALPLFGAGGQAKMKTMEVGDLKAEDVPAMIMDHPTVDALGKALEKPLYGIVGFPFFARYKTTLDYKKKEMTFVPSGYDPPDVMAGLTEQVTAMLGGGAKKPVQKFLAPAAQWGIVVAEKAKDDDNAGITIKEVMPGSPAAAAGLKADDRLLTLDGRWTDSLDDLYVAAGYVKPGTTVKVVVKRGKDEKTLTVKPASGL